MQLNSTKRSNQSTSLVLRKIAQEVRPTNFLRCDDYLQSLFEHAKKTLRKYNYLQFAADLGFSPTNAIRLVIMRRRRLSKRSAEKIAKALALSRQEKRYFVLLAEYQLKTLASSKSNVLLRSLEQKNASIGTEDQANLMRYFSSWIHPIVLEATKFPEFEGTADWFSKNFFFKTSDSEVLKSLELLAALGLIELSQDKSTVQRRVNSAQTFLKDATAEYLSFQRYHEECLELSKEALHKVSAQQRDFNVLTLTLSNEKYKELQTKIKELCQWALTHDESESSSTYLGKTGDFQICQLSTQLFQLIKRTENN